MRARLPSRERGGLAAWLMCPHAPGCGQARACSRQGGRLAPWTEVLPLSVPGQPNRHPACPATTTCQPLAGRFGEVCREDYLKVTRRQDGSHVVAGSNGNGGGDFEDEGEGEDEDEEALW